MLKRLYIHNYKCLVNFEIHFDQDVSLFLGGNGSGKSTVFEVLKKIIDMVLEEKKIATVFNHSDKTRWLQREPVHSKIEIDVLINGELYQYALTFDLGVYPSDNAKIIEEMLYYKNEKLFDASEEFEFDSTRSCLYRSGVVSHVEKYKTLPFWAYLQTIFVVRINPYSMSAVIEKSTPTIESDFSNFSNWFAHLNEKYRKQVSVLEKNLVDILPGFDYFRIELAGRGKILVVDFKNIPNGYDFNELSEGQKALIALYALVYCTPENSLICIDEPENFLALPEIQPWLNELRDKCIERNLQVLLISHHPSLINFLAPGSGYWFSRKDNHTRYEKITEQDEGGLSIAQLIEIGWIYGD